MKKITKIQLILHVEMGLELWAVFIQFGSKAFDVTTVNGGWTSSVVSDEFLVEFDVG